jgi:hypothetical protein
MLEALERTRTDPRLMARPIGMIRGGYWISGGIVWTFDPLSVERKVIRAQFPPAERLNEDWELVERI